MTPEPISYLAEYLCFPVGYKSMVLMFGSHFFMAPIVCSVRINEYKSLFQTAGDILFLWCCEFSSVTHQYRTIFNGNNRWFEGFTHFP